MEPKSDAAKPDIAKNSDSISTKYFTWLKPEFLGDSIKKPAPTTNPVDEIKFFVPEPKAPQEKKDPEQKQATQTPE
jgi:hypothetical protein